MRVQRNHQRERAIADMRARGLSLAQVAAKLGVSRQAIHRVCQRIKREAEAVAKTPVDPPAPQE